MRTKTKPSTAKCNISIYTLFLLSEPKYVSCVRLSDILANLSHDSINRFLVRENYTPQDLFDEVSDKIELVGGTVSVDDMVIDKPYSHPKKVELIAYFWSGKHHKNEGLIVHLKQVGRVKVFRTKFKNEFRYYVRFLPNSDSEKLSSIDQINFEKVHDQHWGIEQYHRAVKQVCNIERFHVRDSQAIRTHIFCSIRAFVQLEFLRVSQKLLNWYSLQRELFTDVIRGFIVNNLDSHFLDLNALEKIA